MVYVSKTGCQWRSLPLFHFPPWPVVYYYFRRWGEKGCLEKAMKTLTRSVRVKQGRKSKPTAAIIDAQSIRTAPGVSAHKGWDGAKKLKGRKRTPAHRHLRTALVGDGG
jgi:putative transposase